MTSIEHQHHHVHDHEHGHRDPGVMYKENWVQDLIQQLKDFVVSNHGWLGLDASKQQRVLDYACGNGTISEGLARVCPQTTFRGIDILPAQVTGFNEAAASLLGNDITRMFAIEGDLYNPTPTLQISDWHNFDLAITSMALHHFHDPVDMLRRLAKRVKPGGTVVVVDWLNDIPLPRNSTGEKSKKPYHPSQNADSDDMEEVHGQKVWMGFTMESMKECMDLAGLDGCEVRLHPGLSRMPVGLGGDKQIFYAKGIGLFLAIALKKVGILAIAVDVLHRARLKPMIDGDLA